MPTPDAPGVLASPGPWSNSAPTDGNFVCEKVTTWVAFQLRSQYGPIPDERYIIRFPDGSESSGRTSRSHLPDDPSGGGFAEYYDITAGTCEITFPDLHPMEEVETVSTGVMHVLRRDLPVLRPEWSRADVCPVHVDPHTAQPADHCEVKLRVHVDHVPDETEATIDILPVGGGDPPDYPPVLLVREGRVIDPGTNDEYKFHFDSLGGESIYKPWNEYLYHFKATIEYRNAEATTREPLCRNRRIVLLSDQHADYDDDPTWGIASGLQCDRIKAKIEACGAPGFKAEHHRIRDPHIEAHGNFFKATIHNSYAWMVCSHGDSGAWKLGSYWFDVNHVKTLDAPPYVVAISTCLTVQDETLADAFLAQGVRYVVGFRGPSDAQRGGYFLGKFFETWLGTHHGDPDKVPDAFTNAADRAWQISPRLFGEHADRVPQAIRDQSAADCVEATNADHRKRYRKDCEW